VAHTNETVHASIPGAQGMTTIAHRLPNRGHVVNIDPSQVLYYHATASGLAFLAFASAKTADAVLALKREKITEATITSKADLRALADTFRAQGYSHTRNTFEADVSSIAMPFFQDAADPAGCLALALPRNDLTDERRDTLLPFLKEAAARMETALTGL
jgi:DNA-binding IclR family transcriptional regulator